MKMHQENNGFSPIAIVLETKEDAERLMKRSGARTSI